MIRWLALGLAALLPGIVAASYATPVANPPSHCTVQPIELSYVEFVAKAMVSPGTSISPTDLTAPTDAEIDALIGMSVACVNANQPLRWLALTSDRYIYDHFGPAHPDDLDSLIAALTRSPDVAVEEDWLTILEISPLAVGEDGRYQVTVITQNADNRFTDLVYLDFDRDGWKIDGAEPGQAEPRKAHLSD